jgi:dihydropyrimidinase
VIDPHTHVSNNRPMGPSFARESPSMLLGGTTTQVDMLAGEHGFMELIEEAIAAIESSCVVDAALTAIVMTEQHADELPIYVERYGITSFKMYMGAGGPRLDPTTIGVDDGLLVRVLRQAKDLGPGVLPLIHAENWELARHLSEALKATGRTDAAAWTDARPNVCEEDCLRRLAFWLEHTGSRAYAVHLSTRQAPEVLAQARAGGVELVGETTPHFLTMHRDHPNAMLAKYNPAIKGTEDVEALWAGLRDGALVGSPRGRYLRRSPSAA